MKMKVKMKNLLPILVKRIESLSSLLCHYTLANQPMERNCSFETPGTTSKPALSSHFPAKCLIPVQSHCEVFKIRMSLPIEDSANKEKDFKMY